MVDYHSLVSEATALQEREDHLLSDAEKIIEAAGHLSEESARVADVAHRSEAIMREIDQDFAASTGIINSTDMSFLFAAVAMQCIRWALLNKLTERTPEGTSKFEDWAHKIQDKAFGSDSKIPNMNPKRTPNLCSYYVPFDRIISTYSVPYDAVKGTKDFNVGGDNKGLSGHTHRYRTLGHDPILGFIFGTANILSSTLTNWKFSTFFVNESNVVFARASTIEMFQKVTERAIRDPKALGAAVIKQGLHLVSDAYTSNGLPLPVIQTLSPELAQQLGKYGIDTGGLLKATASMKLASLIDSIIAMVHGLYYDETISTLSQYEVRTRKILMISNTIAEGSNILSTAITGDIYNLDLGGIVHTVYRLLKDIDFITEIKLEYMRTSFGRIISGESGG